jgi:cysteine desulfurase/selenocysteine lyase
MKPDIRQEFPILHQQVNGHPLVYLDSAASSQKPQCVIDAISHFYARDYANVHRGLHELSNRSTAAFEAARARVATFLNAASPEEIVFTRGTTESINLVAQAWGDAHLRPGEAILLTEMEHHSNLVPWQLLAARRKARLLFIPVDTSTGLLDLSRLDELLSDGVRLAAFTHISNSLGTINPVQELCAAARRHGVLTLIDAAQSAGHRPIDVRAIGCDFLAFSGHKVCGPSGIGVLYGRSDILQSLPPWQGGGEMISYVRYDGSEWKPAPYRFEAGTPDISGAIGLAAALDFLDRIGRDAIAEHDTVLAQYAYDRLGEIPGLIRTGPATGRAGLVSFQMGDVHAHDVVSLADQYGVALRGGHHCNQPLLKKMGMKATSRASFYLYNTKEEIDRLVDVLHRVREFFAR